MSKKPPIKVGDDWAYSRSARSRFNRPEDWQRVRVVEVGDLRTTRDSAYGGVGGAPAVRVEFVGSDGETRGGRERVVAKAHLQRLWAEHVAVLAQRSAAREAAAESRARGEARNQELAERIMRALDERGIDDRYRPDALTEKAWEDARYLDGERVVVGRSTPYDVQKGSVKISLADLAAILGVA